MKYAILVSISSLAILVVFFMPPIMQDPLYHLFADQRAMMGLPNAFDVLSNLPFILVGGFGLLRLRSLGNESIIGELAYLYRVFFIAVILIGAGSFYYHLQPDNASLVWDRLPMTLAFMAFFSIVLAEYLSIQLAVVLFPLLMFCGLFSVLYWAWSESIGRGDLRPYVLVQFLPIVLLPFLLKLGSGAFTGARYYWLILLCYLIAKLLEHLDQQLFDVLQWVSGHSLKHLISALAVWVFIRMLSRRRRPQRMDGGHN